MSRLRTFPIDGERLKALILAQGRTLPEASEMVGGSKDYIASVCRSGKATAQCMSLIGLALSIPKDLYIIKEPEPEVPHETSPEEPENLMDALKEIQKLLNRVVELMEVKNEDQKTWRLPFSDVDPCNPGDGDDYPGISCDQQVG